MFDTDVFVIGGGPAGLAAAIAAAQNGLHVTVADGCRFPIDKACGEGLMPDSLASAAALGIVIRPEDGHAFAGTRFVRGVRRRAFAVAPRLEYAAPFCIALWWSMRSLREFGSCGKRR